MNSRPLLVLDLQRHVRQLLDADLILVGDSEALTEALTGVGQGISSGNEQLRTRHLEQFIHTLEALVASGDLVAAEAYPALTEARRALETGSAHLAYARTP